MDKYEIYTGVFALSEGEWSVRIGMEVLRATWPDKGSALAGLETECRRRGIHKLSRDCWCRPEVMEVK